MRRDHRGGWGLLEAILASGLAAMACVMLSSLLRQQSRAALRAGYAETLIQTRETADQFARDVAQADANGLDWLSVPPAVGGLTDRVVLKRSEYGVYSGTTPVITEIEYRLEPELAAERCTLVRYERTVPSISQSLRKPLSSGFLPASNTEPLFQKSTDISGATLAIITLQIQWPGHPLKKITRQAWMRA